MISIENSAAYEALQAELSSPVRKLQVVAELWEGSAPHPAFPGGTLVRKFSYRDNLQSFTVERVGEGKFFGFCICQKLNIKLRDVNRELDITTANSFTIRVGVNDLYGYSVFPTFFVTEVNRDENTNMLSITAYDGLYKASQHILSELGFHQEGTITPYDINELLNAMAPIVAPCAAVEGVTTIVPTQMPDDRNLYYAEGANFEGTETLREVLDAIAEACQCIFFINHLNQLDWVTLDRDGDAVLTISKSDYITLKSRTNRRLGTIAHTTELGENYSASLAAAGSTQYIRDNPFLNMRDDVTTLIDDALDRVGGLTINQFECEWRGNCLLEIGDKIELITKDGGSQFSFLLDDTISYDGRLKQISKWSYDDNEDESQTHPTNLGDAVKKTYAKVDKVNKEIELVASEVGKFDERIAKLEITTDEISGSVTKVEKENTTIKDQMATLTNKVEATVTAEDVKIIVQEELDDGITSITTETGFTFNEEGLTVSKEGTEMTTLISEDGMTVYKNSEEVLVANNQGVQAANLHATTYLIVGKYSRFEDYEEDGDYRTGCFWIGEV